MNNDGYKFVDFTYCHVCIHKDVNGSEEPCNSCLASPVNLNSTKPINYKDK